VEAYSCIDKAVLGYKVGDLKLGGHYKGLGEREGRAVPTEQPCVRLAASKSQGLSEDKRIH